MITTTASPATTLLTTNLTPTIDSSMMVSPTAVAGAPVLEGFSTMLTAQLNLLAQPSMNVAMLTAPTPAMLAGIATTMTAPVVTNELTPTLTDATLDISAPTAFLTTSTTTNLTSINPTLTNGSPTITAPSLQQNTVNTTNTQLITATANAPVATAVTTMSAKDTAILSTVTDTLKFIASGAKLGDILPAGQTVQLPTANSASQLTQQSMQTAVQQAVTNTPVVAAPVQIVVAQPQNSIDTPVVTAPVQTAIVQPENSIETQVSTTFVQTVVAQAPNSIDAPVVMAPVQTVVAQQQTPVVMATPIKTPVVTMPAQPPVVIAASIETPVGTTTVQTTVAQALVQAPGIETPVAQALVQVSEMATPDTQALVQAPGIETQGAAAPVQVPVMATPVVQALVQAPEMAMPVAQALVQVPEMAMQGAAAPVQATVAQSQNLIKTPVVIETLVQTASVQPQTPVVTAPIQTVFAQVLVQTPVIETPVNSVLVQPIAAPTPQNESVPAQQNNVTQKIVAATATPEEAIAIAESTPTTTNAIPLLTKTKNISVKEASSDIVSAVSEQDSKPVDNLDAVIAQVIPTAVIVPQVAAQATSVQPKIETATETSSDTTTPNKLTLTSASTLLKEAVANRSNTNGDTANSGNNSSGNTPQNTALPDNALAALLNDNKQSTADLKPFASLLTAEKTDITGATTTAPTTDKTTPQAVTSAVNKLVQDTKIDVPAMTKPLSHPEWNQDLGDRIVWMNNRGISSAEIRMNPQNMGPITVRIDVNQDQATIAFTAQNNEVRTALEASIPKLREMLNTQQLTLADVKVTQQSSTNADSGRSQQQATQTADASTSGQSNRQNNPEVDAQGNPRPVNANGDEIIVDEFANAQVLNMNGTNGLLSVHA